ASTATTSGWNQRSTTMSTRNAATYPTLQPPPSTTNSAATAVRWAARRPPPPATTRHHQTFTATSIVVPRWSASNSPSRTSCDTVGDPATLPYGRSSTANGPTIAIVANGRLAIPTAAAPSAPPRSR